MTKRQSTTEPMEDVSFASSQEAKKQKQTHEAVAEATHENDVYEIKSEFLKKSIFEVYYMEVLARAEDVRLLLEYVGANYRNRSAPADWPRTKGDTMFGYLPQLLHTKPDGSKFELSESKAIAKYVAVLFGLWGTTIEEEATLDMLYDCIVDNVYEVMLAEIWKKPDSKELAAFERMMDKGQLIFQGLERFLVKNGSNGYFLGTKTTLPDISLFSWLDYYFTAYTESAKKHFAEPSSSFPGIYKVYQRLHKHPRLRAYIDGGRWLHKSRSPILSMNYSGFFAKDPVKLHKFYTETLGLKCALDVNYAPGHRYIEYEFPYSDTKFTLECFGDDCPVELRKTTPADSIVLNVRSVFDVHAMLAKKGVEFTYGPKDEGWGCVGEFADPEGNQFTIMSPSQGGAPSA
ncbi:hypothetical protein BGZ73_005420 [Actinomortierella ambigua]|nr:hypothetical protein BGZ73_005420 [Actinomortierella ambigua]